MATLLKFEKQLMKISNWNEEASVPFISGIDIMQNGLKSDLDEKDPVRVGFGKISTIYPYTQQNVYNRTLKEAEVDVVRLENDYIRAIFIPSLGGRLWSLYDKVANKELLYVNDVIRPSNLAVRNAWVSGGVEWNISVIGHSPLTCEQMFTGVVEVEGMQVLRMYEYERIRKITYQMDFFLPEDSKFLLCRMRIVNPNEEMVPMYWWSNMAVPEIEKGRLVVDAESAYTNGNGAVYKVDIPEVNGVNVTYPKRIPRTVDYFFDIPESKRKYITQLDETGYGMIQTSTSRLQGRKLFVWGQARGSQRWQNYLTEKSGNYIEIQAGLAKTQYGCLPMEAQSEWEWIEAYGAIQVNPEDIDKEWDELRCKVGETLESLLPEQGLENLLKTTRESIALQKAKMIQTGSVFGALENDRRSFENKPRLSEHLEFGEVDEDNEWVYLLREKSMGQNKLAEGATKYMMDDIYFEALQKAVVGKDKEKAYTWYHLGLNYLVRGNVDEAIDAFEISLQLEETGFNHHALAIAYGLKGEKEKTIAHSKQALERRGNDVGLVKDCVALLVQSEDYEGFLESVGKLPNDTKENTRVKAYKAFVHAKLDQMEEAEAILKAENYLEVEDLREGECFTSELWEIIQSKKEEKEEIPFELDFRANI